eukprot:4877765-Pleurochrysis_carterae.AAC.3
MKELYAVLQRRLLALHDIYIEFPNQHFVKHCCRLHAPDRVAGDISHIRPSALTALLQNSVAPISHLGLLPSFGVIALTQSAVLRYAIDIAIEPDHIPSCPRDQLFTFLSLVASTMFKPSQRAALFHPYAQFPIFYLRRMRTCGALALRSPSSEIP